jgi:hypothetical protein
MVYENTSNLNNTVDNNNDFYTRQILKIANDKKFKTFFKDSFTNPLSSFILTELYPYVYLSIILVIISFLLILSIFVLLFKQFNFLTLLLNQQNINISNKK